MNGSRWSYGGGLDLRPRDMARSGLLYLRRGRWGEQQVVPASWVASSERRHVKRWVSDRASDTGLN